MRYATSFADLKGLKIFSIYNQAGYLYGLYAGKNKQAIVNALKKEREICGLPALDEGHNITIYRTGKKTVSDPEEVEICDGS